MRCIICGNKFDGAICSRCKYDESKNRERYPTLEVDGTILRSNGALRDELFASLTDNNSMAQRTGGNGVHRKERPDTMKIDKTNAVLAHGMCGKQLKWTLYADGVLTISGSGTMKDYNNSNDIPWLQYQERIAALELQSGLGNIGKMAFRGCTSLTRVTFLGKLTNIGNWAFDGCVSLKRVVIPDSVKSIGSWAFHNCKSMTSVTIPKGVTSIGDGAFSNCPSLIIHSDEDSTAEAYAKRNRIPFVKR